MKSHTMFYSQFFSVFIIALMMTLASCSVSKRPKQDSSVTNQLGDAIQTHLVASKASSELEITTALSRMKVSKSSKVIISKHKDNIIHLYSTDTLLLIKKNKYRGNEISEKLVNFDDTPSAISTLITLFPIDAYRILTYAAEKNLIDKSSLLAIAVEYNIDPTIVLDASATGMENSVTPLIHSAGIVIYGQDEDNSSEVKYRKVGDNKWLPALELAWEPIYGALSGSIVHLEPDTQYEVEIVVTDYLETKNQYFFDFKTRPNSPPIDPEKIYYLSEIYNGGQLDLEALNIYGDENGYAKIIGDGTLIEAGEEYLSAVNIGSQAYVMLENLKIKGGRRYGIYAKNTHNIWVNKCDISGFGRIATFYKNNIGYESTDSNSPINYDSGIYLEKTGNSVVENCEIHSPIPKANHWGYGHPNGPNALQIHANHPQKEFQGQIIVRYNRFYGTNEHRFNDIIEGRKNAESTGGFVRDSAIHDNYLAFANDDLIEIDGGQRNVTVYNNEMTAGYVGISITPNMLGPSYIFHNYIHDLGDERGKEWAAIKAGGLMSLPGGKSYIIENYINTNRNGIAASAMRGDSTFWLEARNNIIINRLKNNNVGLGVLDKEKYSESKFINNIIFNTKVMRPYYELNIDKLSEHPDSYVWSPLWDTETKSLVLPVLPANVINNFSRSQDMNVESENHSQKVLIDDRMLTRFHNQATKGTVTVFDGNSVLITGNGWYKVPLEYNFDADDIISFDLRVEGYSEVVGISFETDNILTQNKVLQFAGTQSIGHDLRQKLGSTLSKRIELNLSEYNLDSSSYIVFILDNDDAKLSKGSKVYFEDIKIVKGGSEKKKINETVGISVGLTSEI
ncbi:right-handed parallel beta-helix repeat-containing protein [Alteromonas sp. Mac1]|uniref:right-handed parallel beta-helix repeat-containing protein n=1 Tax=Alteromonas sp. Mac1 TaxID=1777491 RepID=UPI00077000C7|nr:right-handed parallel beta-helix repeat-containing protein [Alteromonas sp. Mac1]AMJ86437.1 hypothetical protein AV939_07475 [Alteromonas sp. Mac1]AMJ90296.1 hypothetical protein AV940_07305 [Alteromonas sp. Mac2]